ncbi:MAG: ribosome biogenesis factor YjgA [Candidatus Competibacteraceae bacterium]|nr:ribosome biogenesis factor YjgA [Candidatus Competibacteraceae bacterium]
MNDQEPYQDQEFHGPSKSQRKREAAALQDTGARLVELPAAQLDNIPMPPELRQAVLQARTISARGGRRRQLQYIGKLMRRLDPQPILQALEDLDRSSLEARRCQHDLERLVEELIGGDQGRLEGLLEQYPQAEAQPIRQLIRNARKERDQDKPPRSRRALFRHLREIVRA